MESAESLDSIGMICGSPLSSIDQDLLVYWESLLSPLRTAEMEVLQIGVGSGETIRTWATWFDHASVIGLDARRIRLPEMPPNCTLVHGDQTDVLTAGELCRTHAFGLVIDDGSVKPYQKLQTFLNFVPWLAPGAVYICVSPPSWSVVVRDNVEDESDELPATELAAWFGKVGASLASGRRSMPPLHTAQDVALHRTKGVAFFPGSIVIRIGS